VVDTNGTPVPKALVLYREMNPSLFPNKTGVDFASQNGELRFKALNEIVLEAFDSSGHWGRLSLSSRTNGTIMLSPVRYTGTLIDYYLKRKPDAPVQIRERLEAVRNTAPGSKGIQPTR
jgi:hypothetical protein